MKAVLSLMCVFAVCLVVGLLAGCGGHSGQVPVGGGGPPVTTASYVGRAVCAACHSDINTAFGTTAHGKDFTNLPGLGNLITGFGGACQPCHTVGFGMPTGFTTPAATPQLAGIGCEDCHGPGSLHAASPSASNIKLTPVAKQTCFNCHVSSYKAWANNPNVVTTDADLAGTAPGSVEVRDSQALMLMGVLAYNRAPEPGPHSLITNSCVDCHLAPVHDIEAAHVGARGTNPHHGADALQADYSVCATCHGSATHAQAKVARAQNTITQGLITIGGASSSDPTQPDTTGSGGMLGAYAAKYSIDLKNNSNPTDPHVKNYKGARFDWSYLQINGTAAHNVPFAQDMISDAELLLSN